MLLRLAATVIVCLAFTLGGYLVHLPGSPNSRVNKPHNPKDPIPLLFGCISVFGPFGSGHSGFSHLLQDLGMEING